MQEADKISIVTPAYNSAKYIGQCIESVQAQTYSNWELLITDDASTDDTCAVVESYAARDSRVRLLRLKNNSGAGVARNTSLEAATGRYIAFLDSDDRWYPHKLEWQLEFMHERGAEICYCSYDTCDEDDHIMSTVRCSKKTTYRDICCNGSIGTSTLLYDTTHCGKVFMPHIRRRQDWCMKIKLMRMIPVAYGIQEPLVLYRVRKGSLSRNKFNLIRYNVEVYHTVLEYSYPKAWLMFLFVFMPTYIYRKCRGM